jgi:hypothetical protein
MEPVHDEGPARGVGHGRTTRLRLLVVTVAMPVLVALAASPVAAAPRPDPASIPTPIHLPFPDLTLPGSCSFPVLVHAEANSVQLLDLGPDKSGIDHQLVWGQLLLRFTNVNAPSKSIVQDASGPSIYSFNADHSGSVTEFGNTITVTSAGDAYAPGIWFSDGVTTVAFTDHGYLTSVKVVGPIRNLCLDID